MEMVRRTRGMLLAGGAAACVLGSCGSSDEPEEAAPPPPPPPAVVKSADPVAAFAPLVRHHQAEEAFPIGAGRFLDRSTLKWKEVRCIILETVAVGPVAESKAGEQVPALDPARLGGPAPYRRQQLDANCRRPRGPVYTSDQLTRPYNPGKRPAGLSRYAGFYVDLLTDSYDGDPRFARSGAARRVVGAPVYFERRPIAAADGRGLRVTYWMLYAHEENLSVDGERVAPHEGDWQRVDVVLRRGSGANTWRPVSVSPDAGGKPVPWRTLQTVAGGDSATRSHPVLFAARSSHTFYATPGRRSAEFDTQDGKVRIRDDASTCAGCVQWRTWDDLLPVRSQPWYGFRGGWGFAFRADAESGPLGPVPGRP